MERIDEVGMADAFEEILPYRRRLEECRSEVTEWIAENEDEVESDFTLGLTKQLSGDDYSDTADDVDILDTSNPETDDR